MRLLHFYLWLVSMEERKKQSRFNSCNNFVINRYLTAFYSIIYEVLIYFILRFLSIIVIKNYFIEMFVIN